ncbi:TetR/AcrR family transcriptional regulator [uncultured Paraglaciecola sp.]|uniref:TetR/AcrR family transcriptional regulator n=1 Tax=uncultured Paraglaciecola sp. TaxID=1765024 RepID=UPI0025999F60|nr:TetR/AcrR family transcriptional regulator [uncultured Paraglaciecola sp.]
MMRKNAKFDRAEVVNNATKLYWEKGFNGTSMRNLQDVIDMRPGSIYATFGSKEGLFKEALNRYADMGIEELLTCRKAVDSPLKALKLFMKSAVLDYTNSAPSRMCMLAKTMGELTEDNADLLQEAKRLLAKIEAEFVTLLQEAQELGEVDSNKDVHKLARHIQVQTMGLRTYAKACDDHTILETLVDDVFKHHPF